MAGVRQVSVTAIASILVAIGATAECAYLFHVNQRLAAASLRLDQQELDAAELKVGDTVVQVTGYDSHDLRRAVSLVGKARSVVFSVSSVCPACENSLDAFRRLASNATSRGMTVVFVSRDYVFQMQGDIWTAMPGIVISEPTYRTHRNFKLEYVPQVAVIAGDGRIEEVRSGQMNSAKEAAIAQAISR